VSRRTVNLVERRTRTVRLPSADVAFLHTHARHVVEVAATFHAGCVRLTPRGYVGWLDSPHCRFAIAPKIPWPNLQMLLGLPASEHAGEAVDHSDILAVFSREFAAQLRVVTRVGLVAGYREADTTAPYLRGRLRTADQLRDAAARAFPDRFHITESVLDLDTSWNRILRATADSLQANPDLSLARRIEVRDAARVFGEVSSGPLREADFAAAENEPRIAHYRPLLAVCRLLRDGLAAAQPQQAGSGGFLIDLSRAFERYLSSGLTAALSPRPAWSLETHPGFAIGTTVLQPDILLRRRGEARCVLDTKWKTLGAEPDAADLHQILAYATITGAKHVGLVYPGHKFGTRAFGFAGSDIRVSLVRVRVVGTVAECSNSLAKLATFARRRG